MTRSMECQKRACQAHCALPRLPKPARRRERAQGRPESRRGVSLLVFVEKRDCCPLQRSSGLFPDWIYQDEGIVAAGRRHRATGSVVVADLGGIGVEVLKG